MRFGYAKVISFCFSTMSFVKKKKKTRNAFLFCFHAYITLQLTVGEL